MINVYQGDPKLYLDENGADLEFIDGQPIMDAGLENLAAISLCTIPGWVGNDLFRTDDEKIGSDYIPMAGDTITITSLNRIRDAALKALDNPAFGEMVAEVNNPTGHQIQTSITIKPPGADIMELLLTKHGLNWQIQGSSPASGRNRG